MELISKDAKTGEAICTNDFTNFVKGSGGFGSAVSDPEYQAAPTQQVPSRKPDSVQRQQTSLEQAALYRLNGDRNPLHIDPSVSRQVGFEKPILHGLCTFGIAARHVFRLAATIGMTTLQVFKVNIHPCSMTGTSPAPKDTSNSPLVLARPASSFVLSFLDWCCLDSKRCWEYEVHHVFPFGLLAWAGGPLSLCNK